MHSAERKPGLEVLRLAPSDARSVPWKNGRGVTRELALWPSTASFERDDYDWRISSAAVDEPGSFSVFPELERILVVTEGAGLVLTHGTFAPRARLRRLDPYRFLGAWPTAAELPYGPVSDFNVMVRAERARASVQSAVLGGRRMRETLRAGQAFVHVLAGSLVARVTGQEQPYELAAGCSLWVRGLRGGEELDLVGQARELELLLVSLEAAP